MKKLTLMCVLITLFAVSSFAQNDTLQLARDGKTSYVIALASDAIPAEKTAAEQFQKYFSQITGATIPVKSESDVNADVSQILIGVGARTKVLLPQQNWDSLGGDGIVIKTVGKNLVLAGGRPRGALYAVFQFLEDEAGARWWTPTESTIPHKSTFSIKPQNITYVPPFSYREHYTTSVRQDPIFATIMRENGHHQNQNPDWGGHYSILGFVHTFSRLLPAAEYFKDHPEWYSDPSNDYKPGTSDSAVPGEQRTDLCLGNPEVLDAVTEKALAWIDKNPEAGYISISQNDHNGGYCRDDYSVNLVEKEGSPAAPMIDFVNKVAARIHKKYPGFKVETLAYHHTEKPPKTIRPAKDVIIRLAPISADFSHPLDTDKNKEARDNLLEWAEIAPDLFVWNYVTNFHNTMFPHPNWTGIGADLRFFAANNVKGIFEQGDSYTNGVGDFVQLRTWLIARLMWNPQLDQEELTNEFLSGYYGAAAPYLKQYLDGMQAAYLSSGRKLSTFNPDFSFITVDVANKSIQLFDEAENAVKDNPQLLQRVQRERLSFTIGMLYQYNLLKRNAAHQEKEFLGPKDPSAAMNDFIEAAQKFGVQNWKEGGSFEMQIPVLRGMYAAPASLPDWAKQYPQTDVIDLQAAQFRLWQQGKMSFLEKDEKASKEMAASVAGNTKEWAIQVDLGQHLSNTSEKWHVYEIARVEASPDVPQTDIGFQSGIYDTVNKESKEQKSIPLTEFDGGEYKKIDLGVHELNSGMYIWIAPTQNPAVKKVFVDRIILIREK